MFEKMGGIIPVASQLSDDLIAKLPEEVRTFAEAQKQKQQTIIDALTTSIKSKRDEAVKARLASGIETQWTEDEEFYEGIDDANRNEPRMIKPNHPSGAVTTSISRNKKTRSTVFMNITRQYVNSAAASVSEISNPTDDRNFSIKPTPIPDLAEKLQDNSPAQKPSMVGRIAGYLGVGRQPQQTVAQQTQQIQDEASAKAKAAQAQIDDWLVECQWHAHLRSAVLDAAKVGTGVLKGPVPVSVTKKRTKKGDDGSLALIIEEEVLPATAYVSYWNIYPDPTCGGDIHRGSYMFEHDELNARQVRELKNLPDYLSDQIDKALELGPQTITVGQNTTESNEKKDTYHVWYYYGLLTRDEIEAMNVKDQLNGLNEVDKKAIRKIETLEACPCIVTMIGDIAVKAHLNPLDSGEFPYDFIRWETVHGSPWGRGVGRITRPAQRIITATVRNLMDNAGASSGVVLGVKRGAVVPMGGGDWKIGPGTIFEITDESVTDLRQVFSSFEVPSRQKELLEIIQFGQKMAEDITGMPLLLQGQTGSAPDTVGGMQLLNRNATATRRMVAKRLDDDVVEPHIRRYYDWVLMYCDDSMKGDMSIDARGFQSLVERDIQRQTAIQMLQLALQPAYGVNAYKAMSQALRADMCDPKDWQYTEDEFKQNQENQQKAPDPAIQAAQINAQARVEAAKIQAQSSANDTQVRGQAAVQSTQIRTQRDAAYEQQIAEKNRQDGLIRMKELEITREIALLDYANKRNINLDKVKGELAATTMKLQTEKELAAVAANMEHVTNAQEQSTALAQQAADQTHAHAILDKQHAYEMNVANLQPAVQVPGRAGNGQALSQMPK